MKDLKTYEFVADESILARAVESGFVPANLEPVFRTVVSEIISGAGAGSVSVYVCSPEGDAEVRNRFAFLVAKLVRAHVPGAVLVDCDFLSTGMNGIVPRRDALGFLDLLLYGMSLGVITQEAAHGVRVIGAGSFAVTKKSPFAMDAFADARRYLVAQARCVIFVGPVADDEGNVHPVTEAVDRVVLVRMGSRFDAGTLDSLEQKIASSRAPESWSVRISRGAVGSALSAPAGTAPGVPAAGAPRQKAPAETTVAAEVEDIVGRWGGPGDAKRPDKAPTTGDRAAASKGRRGEARPPVGRVAPSIEEEIAPPHFRGRSGGTKLVRLATSLVVLVLVAFVVWWLYLTRSVRERGVERPAPARRTVATQERAHATDSLAGRRSAEQPKSATEEPKSATEVPAPATRIESEPVESERAAGGAGAGSAADTLSQLVRPFRVLSTPDSIYIAASLSEFTNRYVVHAGSFRGIDKAKEEALYLLGWGYSVFIYRVDLEDKGVWYRVYVGPFATQDDAMASKIMLDENPRIRSTRVSKVPG